MRTRNGHDRVMSGHKTRHTFDEDAKHGIPSLTLQNNIKTTSKVSCGQTFAWIFGMEIFVGKRGKFDETHYTAFRRSLWKTTTKQHQKFHVDRLLLGFSAWRFLWENVASLMKHPSRRSVAHSGKLHQNNIKSFMWTDFRLDFRDADFCKNFTSLM